MTSSSHEPARSAVRPGPLAGAADPTEDERAAAAALLRMIWGLHTSRAVYLAAELGVADLLAAGPRTAAALARATQADEAALRRVLRLLAALGVLTESEPGSFGLTVLGDRLRSDVPASMRNWAMLADTVGFGAHEPILEAVRTGRTGTEIAYGTMTMERVRGDAKRAARFDAAMSERTAAFAPGLTATYDFSGMRVIADIGGGQGTLLAAILRRHQQLRGILFDVADVTRRAGSVLRDAGVASRCEIIAGDFFAGVPEGADGYILANVLHDWDDSRAVQILQACRRAMGTRGRVLIAERLIPDNPHDAVPVLLSDLNMLLLSGGQERTTAEYGTLLAAAGLQPGRIQPVATPYGVIEGFSA
jgi:O-methyltransferase domain/Dimerisation domain